MIIAQGKATEAAALGKTPPRPTLFFPFGLARQRRTKPKGKKSKFFRTATQGGARSSLALGYYQAAPPGLRAWPRYGKASRKGEQTDRTERRDRVSCANRTQLARRR